LTEAEVRELLVSEFNVSRETLDRLSAFLELLRGESDRQNLVSRGTLDVIWSRHILDSVQLVRFAPNAGTWLDLGTGAGFPGLIIAAVHPARMTMVESRKLRVEFLTRAASVLGVSLSTRIICDRVERIETATYDVISARAFAPLETLLTLGQRFAAPQTRWVLPKGRAAQSEVDAVLGSWQGVFHVEPSITDPEAGIIVAEQVSRVRGGQRAR
jgi:16S rRNA (guanine527-N7)-methyltransferase